MAIIMGRTISGQVVRHHMQYVGGKAQAIYAKYVKLNDR